MEISVDISMYPLQKDFEAPILAFIAELEKEKNVEIVRNELSTQVHGEYKTIMALLEQEMFSVFAEIPDSIFVLKFVGNNRRGMYGV
ncbi:hypothetical protein [Sulfurovum sp.]|uniref:hypothetical protein n=1 Tax=Sulfurovum sp. TaxID=1969726 RepID=UPI0028682069|nr:hypothetical protein [Sulfurovum sp.]